MGLALRNTYATELKGMYLPFLGNKVPDPKILRLNNSLASDLGISSEDTGLAAMLVGMAPPEGAVPLAMAYAGHQFGGFSPSLGDGRAMLLAEVTDSVGVLRDIHLKGSGRTPFSRGADGKAALGPVLREYLMGEAMFALGVPTTRALAVVTTGERILRDQGLMPGAVLARVASSHLRVGTFQFFAARAEVDQVRRLLGYAIGRHDPDLAPTDALGFLGRVARRQAALIARWMGIGFVHGVMNTDNMAISGETIDYGPCAFLDTYDPAAVFSSIDHQGRYAFGNQPAIARWNIARLAEALLPLIDANEEAAIAGAMQVINAFPVWYEAEWARVMGAKLGFAGAAEPALAQDLLDALAKAGADYTMTFRSLSSAVRGDAAGFLLQTGGSDAARDWLARWRARLAADAGDPAQIAAGMDAANPVYIPRNHLVEEALDAAIAGDMGPFDRMVAVLSDPFRVKPRADMYALGAPAGLAPHVTYCGT
jgi:uncharacterized protein YdiU (UPF0061 family)